MTKKGDDAMIKLAPHVLEKFVQDSNAIENIAGATEREIDVHKHFLGLERVTLLDVCDLVNVLAKAPLRNRPDMNVGVGKHVPPRGGDKIAKALDWLLANSAGLHPLEVHQLFLWLHPFMDGNGRAGRALWLRAMLETNQVTMVARYGVLRAMYYQHLERGDPGAKAAWSKLGWDF